MFPLSSFGKDASEGNGCNLGEMESSPCVTVFLWDCCVTKFTYIITSAVNVPDPIISH